MKNSAYFTCFLIGKDNLLLECAKILRARSALILGIVTQAAPVRKWAYEHDIPCFDSLYDIDWKKDTIDYLFSIVNDKIIPPEVLQKIFYLTINFHDAPLPRYAGSNATSWAIIHNEKKHGITWHVVNEMINGGELLKQVEIPIAEDETVLSLNIKCLEQGIISFAELIDELAEHSYEPVPQDITNRTFFSRKQKPENNGCIDWGRTADEIFRLWRATQFETVRNPFSSVKMLVANDVFIINSFLILNEKSKYKPGTLVRLNSSSWTVSTASYDVLVADLRNLHAEKVALEEIGKRFQIKKGDVLPVLSSGEQNSFRTLSQQYFAFEEHWIERLNYFEPTSLPLPVPEVNICALPQAVYNRFLDFSRQPDEAPLVMLTVWIIYLYRSLGQSQIGVCVRVPVPEIPATLRRFFSSFIPLSLAISEQDSFMQILQQLRNVYADLRQKKTFLADLWCRYPEFAGVLPPDRHSHVIDMNTEIDPDLVPDHGALPTAFITLCNQLLSHRDTPVADVEWLSQLEQKKILVNWNQTNTPYPEHKTIHRLFEEQAYKTPDQTALICEDIQLSYLELNIRVNQLAHFLKINHGIRPDQIVAVYLERSHWMLIALLGILKAGGACLPIDTHYPASRINCLLNDSHSPVILTTQNRKAQLCRNPAIGLQKIKILVVDDLEFGARLEQQSNSNPRTPMSSRQLAYVMYASGHSKGVLIEHQGIVNRIEWMNTSYPLSRNDRILQKAPYASDVSVWEMYWALWHGATVVISAAEGRKEPECLGQLIHEKKISIVHFTPTMLKEFIPLITRKRHWFLRLRHVFCSGEVLEAMTLCRLKTLLPNVEVHALHGSAEVSIDALYHDCAGEQAVYLGKPIANIRAYVLDEKLRLLPEGVCGELHLAGDGLARGYLNQPELTGKKFPPNPYRNEDDKKNERFDRLYKTGDLVRWRPNGNLEYVGRTDRQISFQGHRIDLSEIEHVMQSMSEIRESLVVVCGDSLIAYYAAHSPIDPCRMQAEVKHFLPDYMLPKHYVHVYGFPLTIHGKTDLAKLPLPGKKQPGRIRRPVTVVQQQIAAVFAVVLGLQQDEISSSDDFFNMGGDSILAIRLVSLLNDLFQKSIQVRQILQLKTVQAIGQFIDELECKTHTKSFPPFHYPRCCVDQLKHHGQRTL